MAPHGAARDVALEFAHVIDLLALPLLLLAAAALTVRFRRSRGVERLQLKWFTYTAVVVGVGLGLAASAPGAVADIGFLVGLLALAALPVAAGRRGAPLPPLRHRRRHPAHADLRRR